MKNSRKDAKAQRSDGGLLVHTFAALRLCVRNFCRWISRMLSEGDGTPSTKRVCFFFATTSSIALCVGLFLRHGAESAAVDLMKWLLTTAGAAYGITRFAEYGKGEPPQ